jgi:Cu(I)/Ag(I) efflux system membrane protein CusA/SilA
MTVSTVVAGLLPIMWSTRVGAEVMKPIAAPVLGGMLSSLAHVLLVTPVIFFWLRARTLEPGAARARPGRRWIIAIVATLVIVLAAALVLRRLPGRGATASEPTIQQVQSGELIVLLRSGGGSLHQGHNVFTLEFRSRSTNALVDVRDVHLSGAMTMPGMAMSGGIEVQRLGPGRYHAVGDFGMSGAWRFSLEWNGPAGAGSVSFNGDVR